MAKQTAVAVKDSPDALAELGMSAEELLADSGKGKEHVETKDLAIPFISILQANSPQVNPRDGKYVQGAQQGMIFNSVTKKLYPGEKGILVVPCEYQRRYAEWKLREEGGGLIADYGMDDTVFKTAVRREVGEKKLDMLPNGHQIVESGTHYVLLLDEETFTPEQAVIGMASTQRTKSNRWNTLVSLYQAPHPIDKGKTFNPARFYCAYRLKVVPESRNNQNFWGWDIVHEKPTLELPNGRDLYIAARAFNAAVNQGLVKLQEPQTDAEAAEVGGTKLDDDIPY